MQYRLTANYYEDRFWSTVVNQLLAAYDKH